MNDNQNDQDQKPVSDDPQTSSPQAEAEPAAEPTEDTAAAEIADLKDRLLRTLAEMENLRKRAERDRNDASQYAITGFSRDLLDVADNLRRALESLPADALTAHEPLKPFIEGVEMTERSLLNAFEKHGIERFSPEGEKFDHNRHEAMFEAPTDDHPGGTVVQVIQPGYMLRDRLLRAARVGVAKNSDNGSPDGGAGARKVDRTV